MSNIKKLKTRMVQKHGTKAEWDQATNFIPLEGELVVYENGASGGGRAPAIMVGDGTTEVGSLKPVGKFTQNTTSLSWGSTTTIGYVGDDAIKIKLPSNPDTDTNQKVKSGNTTFGINDEINIIGSGATTVTPNADNKTITISSTDMDTKVTSVGNHYTPSANSSYQLSVDAANGGAATMGTTQVVTGVNIQRDAKGHVTGITVDSAKLPEPEEAVFTDTYHDPLYSDGLDIATGVHVDDMYVPYATPSQYGVVKPAAVRTTAPTLTTGKTTTSRYYGIELDSSGKMFVNVPWTDANTTTSGIAVCSTAAGTAAKTAPMANFSLVSGQYIILRVTTTNTATRSSITLNIGGTGAKSIKIGGSTTTQLYAGDYLSTYDGTYWNLTRIYLTDSNTNYYHYPKFDEGLLIGDSSTTALQDLYVPYASSDRAGVGFAVTSVMSESPVTLWTTDGDCTAYSVKAYCGELYVVIPDAPTITDCKVGGGCYLFSMNNVHGVYAPLANGASAEGENVSDSGVVRGWHHTSGKATGTRSTNLTHNPSINGVTTNVGRYYGVETDEWGSMYVNVPWTDYNTMPLSSRNRDPGSKPRGTITVVTGTASTTTSTYSGSTNKVATPDLLIKYIIGVQESTTQWRGIKTSGAVGTYTMQAIKSMLLGSPNSSVTSMGYSGVAPSQSASGAYFPVSAYIYPASSTSGDYDTVAMFSYSGGISENKISTGSISLTVNYNDGTGNYYCMFKDTYMTSTGSKYVPVTTFGSSYGYPYWDTSLSPNITHVHTDT